MDSDENIVHKYYSNKNVQNFYKKYWGGESIHIGIYDDDYKKSDNVKNDIKFAIQRKTDLIAYLIKTYVLTNFEYITLADFGSGYGGTSRFLYKLFENKLKMRIDNFDLSHENCLVNTLKNIEKNINIPVYNCSFLEIPVSDENYNLVISEDAFIHISDRDRIFKEVKRVLKPSGFLIFSDIILDDNYSDNSIDEVYSRVKTKSLETSESYKKLASDNGLTFINSIDYKSSMLTHYSNIRNVIEDNTDNKDIIEGLDNWVKHIKQNNITTKIFIFKKI